MKIAVTSQNFRTVTGHAGKTTHFLVFEANAETAPREVERLDLRPEMMIHEFRGAGEHPLQRVDALVTGGAGDGFIQRMAAWGVRVAVTQETEPAVAVAAFARGELQPVTPGTGGGHHHAEGDHGGHGHHGCGNC
jgi:predicted Fe-Mo cluster-binding NifX family protein